MGADFAFPAVPVVSWDGEVLSEAFLLFSNVAS